MGWDERLGQWPCLEGKGRFSSVFSWAMAGSVVPKQFLNDINLFSKHLNKGDSRDSTVNLSITSLCNVWRLCFLSLIALVATSTPGCQSRWYFRHLLYKILFCFVVLMSLSFLNWNLKRTELLFVNKVSKNPKCVLKRLCSQVLGSLWGIWRVLGKS